MKILIVGAGRAGLEAAVHLSRIGHAVTIVDTDATVTRRAGEQFGLVAISGDATTAEILEDAGIGRTDIVVAMLRRDADNLAVSLLARAAGVERVMVRMRDNAYRPVYATAGIERVLSETDLITGAVATAIEHDAIRHAMLVGDGSAIAFELTIPPDSAVAGHTVMELAARTDFPRSCVLAALYRQGGGVEAPRGSSVVDANMTVLLVARADEVGRTVTVFTASASGDRTAPR
ncbi:MAG: TrkA family potassium uptake protein [Acidobacteria bacterium SCN 69-37]|nr:MAG: TrkA family potassium uptake protein [Acidobacteria bacterium SCN 69-37]